MSDRSNLWTFVGYPGDSLPENYQQIINSWHISVLESPQHDLDLNADDTEKKNHIHFMIYFGKGANKSYDQVRFYSDQLHAASPEIVNNRNAMTRYFIHRDNPEKHQYDITDLRSYAGFEYMDAFSTWTSEIFLAKKIQSLILEYNVYNFVDLVELVDREGDLELYKYISRNSTQFVQSLLNGQYQKLSRLMDTKYIKDSQE